ncbi:MAG: class I SAM-dependent methyltransferase [Methyloceanibacter sp.]
MVDLPEAGGRRLTFPQGGGKILHDDLASVSAPFAFVDIACGDAGQMPQALAGTQCSHYHGIDLSEPALELAAKNLSGMAFEAELDHRDFLEALTRRPEPADAAWCSLSIHHLKTDEKLALLKPIRGSTQRCLMIYEPTRAEGETREAYLERFRRVKSAGLDHADARRVGADRPSRDHLRCAGERRHMAGSWPQGRILRG